jgi:uncharacterized phage-associated protein
MLPGFDIEKAAQATAFFALKSGGSINVLKLSKLLYIAEREFMRRHDTPMFFDHLISMPDGPVVSVTLNLINGNLESPRWSAFVAPRSGYDIAVANSRVSFDTLKDLSRADLSILEDLWVKFGHFDKYSLRDWTHKKENIPEWEDPNGSSYLIQHENVFKLLGKENSSELNADIDAFRALKQKLENV